MIALRSELISRCSGVQHGFGTKAEPIPTSLRPLWDAGKPSWKQVHGIQVAKVRGPADVCGEADALWSAQSETPIAVVTADCVPILLARRDGARVAAVHAGWRGTRARILRALWEELSAQGERPGDWVAAVGPAIGPCCYEVSEEIAADFAHEFSAYGEKLAVPRHRMLDLPAINEAQLRELGIPQVEVLRFCTRCTRDGEGFAFHSYRREGGGTRQYSMIRAAV